MISDALPSLMPLLSTQHLITVSSTSMSGAAGKLEEALQRFPAVRIVSITMNDSYLIAVVEED
jgi:hypothetical protein